MLRQSHLTSPARRWFWLGFLALNTIMLLPLYLSHGLGHSHFFPFNDFIGVGKDTLRQHLVLRENYDLFRLSSDLVFITLALWLVRGFRFRGFVRNLLFGLYTALFLFNAYYWTFEKIFGNALPYDDFSQIGFITQLAQYDFSIYTVIYAFLALSVLTALYLLYFGFSQAILNSKLWMSRFEQLISVVVIVFCSAQLKYLYDNSQYDDLFLWPEANVQSTVSRIVWSKQQGVLRDRKLVAIKNHIYTHDANRTLRIDTRPPNIYFLLVESYGDVVTTLPKLKPAFTQQFARLEQQLTANNWHVSSNLSSAPITGGRSWLSYGSFFYGFLLDSQKHYKSLLEFAPAADYPSLPKILQDSGYKNFRLSALPPIDAVVVPYKRIGNFSSVNEWITHGDMNYTGPSYGFGPAPPDQFSLNFAHEYIKQQGLEQPHSLFFITQSSHNPFVKDLEVEDDWRNINDGTRRNFIPRNSNFWEFSGLDEYRPAMHYQLDYLTDFILTQGTDNDVFFIIGDHQPPLITPKDASFRTPVHIISRNKTFVAGFNEYGFATGMNYEGGQPVRHEGLHHAVLRELVRHYSSNENLPTYYPEGVEITPTERPRQP